MNASTPGATDRICLKGLSARGRHGVLPLEREEPQLFVVDVTMDLGENGAHLAGTYDQLREAVDYSAVASAVIGVLEGPSVNLIETLATRIADTVLGFPRVKAVEPPVADAAAPAGAVAPAPAPVTEEAASPYGMASPAAPAPQAAPAPEAVVPAFAPVPPVADAAAPEPAAPAGAAPAGAAAAGAAAGAWPEPEEVVPVPPAFAAPEPQAPPTPFDVTAGPLDGPKGFQPEAVVDPQIAAALSAPPPAPFDIADINAEQAVASASQQAPAPEAPAQASAAQAPVEEPAAPQPDAPGEEQTPQEQAEQVDNSLESLIADAYAVEASAAGVSPEQLLRDQDVRQQAPIPPAPYTGPAAQPQPAEPAAAPAMAGLAADLPAQAGPAQEGLGARPAQPVGFVIALGGNVGDVLTNLRKAVASLRDKVGIEVTQVAPLARTASVAGPEAPGQPDYLNTVVLGVTVLSPLELLEVARSLEADAGRVRSQPNGPRTLDVDIIDYQGVISADPELVIPHPRATQRAFVLVPWAEVDDLAEVAGQSVALLAEKAPDRDGVRWLALDWEESDSLPALPTGQYVAPPLVADQDAPEGPASPEAAEQPAQEQQPAPQEAYGAGTDQDAPEPAPNQDKPAEEDGAWDAPVAWEDVLGNVQGKE